MGDLHDGDPSAMEDAVLAVRIRVCTQAQEALPLASFDIPLGLRYRPVGGRGDAVPRSPCVVFGSAQRPPDILSVMFGRPV
ncbi:hypothetical protein ACF1A9_28615 [Streptomyces sp. NPDC014872]|uniref:hypothetical protein n=1 Tax=Streptomyces sp. NPDC014872 TaxID=3364926 RepID=UPI003700334E